MRPGSLTPRPGPSTLAGCCLAMALVVGAAWRQVDVVGASERPPGTGGAFVDTIGDPTAFATEAAVHPGGGGELAAGDGTISCTWGVWIEDDEAFPLYEHEDGAQLHSGTGRWLRQTCTDSATGAVTTRIVPEEGIDPVAVARQALRSVAIPTPAIQTSPAANQGLYVHLPTWLWIDSGWWRSYSASATAGTVTATVEVSPSKVTWDAGDGGSVTCTGPGRAWAPGLPDDATDCSYAYRSASDGQPDGRYRLRATVQLDIGWTSSTGEAGTLPPITRTSDVAVEVGEIQAIETR